MTIEDPNDLTLPDAAVDTDETTATPSSASRVRGPWSPEEDAILSELVSKFGARNWSLIARGIPGRSGKSCRLRWCNQLDPCVKRKPFSGYLSFYSLSLSSFFFWALLVVKF